MSTTENATAHEILADSATQMVETAQQLGLPTVADIVEAEARRRLDRGRLCVVVLGETRHGKSSLINALIGHDALPTGIIPTTRAIVRVRIGGRAGRYHTTTGGKRESVDRERFATLVRAKGRKHAAELEFVCVRADLPSNIEIVDTPGINDLERFGDAISRGHLARADVLILVLDATQLLKRSELALTRDAIAAVGGLDASGARLVAVINRIDLVEKRDRAVLRQHLLTQLTGLGGLSEGSDHVTVFETDARTASQTPDANTHGVRGVLRLRQHLVALKDQGETILPARTRASLLRHAALLSHNAAIQSRALTLEDETLARELADVEKSISEQRLDMDRLRALLVEGRQKVLADSESRRSDFCRQLEISAGALVDTASLRTLTSLLPGALHDAFVSFHTEESERLRDALDELTRRALSTHGEQARRRLAQASMRLGFRGPTVYIDPPSVTLEAGLVAVGILGTAVMYFGNVVAGLLMTVAGPLATVALHEKSLRNARARAKAQIPPALERASAQLADAVSQVVDGHIAGLQEHLELASAALGEQLKAILQRAQSLLDPQEGDGKDDKAARRKRAREQLAGLEKRLSTLDTQLRALTLPG
jgi:small GTP-binding protein